MAEKVIMTTMCVVWDKEADKILMINRIKGNWLGYAPPGGHIDPHESFAGCAIREVKEETGLTVWDLTFKGLVHFVEIETQERYLVFNYITDKFSGELCAPTEEGKPEWISLYELANYPLAPGMEERMELFFAENASELHITWDKTGRQTVNKISL